MPSARPRSTWKKPMTSAMIRNVMSISCCVRSNGRMMTCARGNRIPEPVAAVERPERLDHIGELRAEQVAEELAVDEAEDDDPRRRRAEDRGGQLDAVVVLELHAQPHDRAEHDQAVADVADDHAEEQRVEDARASRSGRTCRSCGLPIMLPRASRTAAPSRRSSARPARSRSPSRRSRAARR